MKVVLVSLGCAKNLVDSEIMLGILKSRGFKIVETLEDADAAIVNTCAFIKDAKQEAIDTIFDLLDLKKQGRLKRVIVAGCLPGRYQKELPDLLTEADGFLGPGNIDKIADVIDLSFRKSNNLFISGQKHYLYKNSTPRASLTPKHYAYVKIADGCNNCCSYCIIPQIRGDYQSRPIESIVKEVKLLVSRGVKEINLISQDTTFYGYDIYGCFSLDKLLRKLVKIRGLVWIRVLYTHPLHLNRSVLKVIAAEPKICKYIDLPIQHINDKILRLMHRRVNGGQIKRLIDVIRLLIPKVVLRTSLIVGFPEETEGIFKELYEFIKQTEFERLGVFKYSVEENTKAALFKDQVSERIKQRRYKKIMFLQQTIVKKNQAAFIGKEIDVLIDDVLEKNTACGRSPYDAPEVDGVVYVQGKNLKAGDLIKVKITDSILYDLAGEKI